MLPRYGRMCTSGAPRRPRRATFGANPDSGQISESSEHKKRRPLCPAVLVGLRRTRILQRRRTGSRDPFAANPSRYQNRRRVYEYPKRERRPILFAPSDLSGQTYHDASEDGSGRVAYTWEPPSIAWRTHLSRACTAVMAGIIAYGSD